MNNIQIGLAIAAVGVIFLLVILRIVIICCDEPKEKYENIENRV